MLRIAMKLTAITPYITQSEKEINFLYLFPLTL
jgi:hypothetical protein